MRWGLLGAATLVGVLLVVSCLPRFVRDGHVYRVAAVVSSLWDGFDPVDSEQSAGGARTPCCQRHIAHLM
eukprot:6213983-Pleurochrysis_carterae.AAC.4